jgi:hypothetical protein
METLLHIFYLLLILLLPAIAVTISTLFLSKQKSFRSIFNWQNALFVLGWWFVFSFSYTLVGGSDPFELYQPFLLYLMLCLACVIVFNKRFGKSHLLSVCFAALILVILVPAVQLSSRPRNNLLYGAAQHNHTIILRMLLMGASQGEMNAALYGAAESGNASLVREILRRGADANGTFGNEDTALNAAKRSGHTDVVELLKEAGAKE